MSLLQELRTARPTSVPLAQTAMDAAPVPFRPGQRPCERDEATGEMVCVKDIERHYVRGPLI
jgi:hypothetical protein